MTSQPRRFGDKECPRAALLGTWTRAEIAALQAFLPTLHVARFPRDIDVDWNEIDLLITSVHLSEQPEWIHSISFADQASVVLNGRLYSTNGHTAESQGFHALDVPPLLASLRDQLAEELGGARGSYVLHESHQGIKADLPASPAGSILVADNPSGAIALATLDQREDRQVGVAWIPTKERRAEWVSALVLQWSKHVKGVSTWEHDPAWMTADQIAAADALVAIQAERDETVRLLAARQAQAEEALRKATHAADRGLRQLLTAQAGDLVLVVKQALEAFRFDVQVLDDSLQDGEAKREDLRLRDPSDPEWLALVEVRGYARRSANNDDLRRLQKFARAYLAEKKQNPSKLIYVVNGQIDLPPDRRHIPFASDRVLASELEREGDSVIATADLFRLCRDFADRPEEARLFIKMTAGVVRYPPEPAATTGK